MSFIAYIQVEGGMHPPYIFLITTFVVSLIEWSQHSQVYDVNWIVLLRAADVLIHKTWYFILGSPASVILHTTL